MPLCRERVNVQSLIQTNFCSFSSIIILNVYPLYQEKNSLTTLKYSEIPVLFKTLIIFLVTNFVLFIIHILFSHIQESQTLEAIFQR